MSRGADHEQGDIGMRLRSRVDLRGLGVAPRSTQTVGDGVRHM
jgi:hypothetical protein